MEPLIRTTPCVYLRKALPTSELHTYEAEEESEIGRE